MAESIRDLLFGGVSGDRDLVEAIDPRRSFDDVVLPATTLRALNHALALVRKHDLIFDKWGLAERHSSGLGLAFHFAGPPGTGKTICAEALAFALNKKLLVVRYAELESRWVGQTSKHVAAVFRAAARQDAVLFFDEADAIAGRRFTSISAAYEREANAVVNVLLHELESFPGVVIFATNLAAWRHQERGAEGSPDCHCGAWPRLGEAYSPAALHTGNGRGDGGRKRDVAVALR